MRAKSVLITGANKSIGYETARQLGRLGYRVWLGSRDAARGASAAQKLSSEGLNVRVIAIDVADDDSVKNAAATVSAIDGKLDVLINNAGIPGSYTAPGHRKSVKSKLCTRPTFSARSERRRRFCLCFVCLAKPMSSWSAVVLDR